MGRSAPACLKVPAFLIFFIDLFYLLFEGFGLSYDTSPLFKSALKGLKEKEKEKSCWWLRSSARVLFCAFSKNRTAC